MIILILLLLNLQIIKSQYQYKCQCIHSSVIYNCYGDEETEFQECAWDHQYACNVCACGNRSRCIDVIEYKATNDGVIYSNMVQTQIKIQHTFVKGPILHSSKLPVGSYVEWPIAPHKKAILQVEYNNVTADHDNCCWSMEVGSECEYKYCCGKGCCC
jgi:hypothetical protein